MQKKIEFTNDQDLLTLQETSKMLGVRPVTLRKWDREGKLKALRVGSRKDRRYRRSDILRVLGQTESKKYDIQEMDGSLHVFFGYIEGFIEGLKQNYGRGISKHLTITHSSHMKIGYPYQELLDIGELVSKKLQKDSGFADTILKEFRLYHQVTEQLIADFIDNGRGDIENVLKEAEKAFTNGMGWTMIVEPLDAYLLNVIKEKLKVDPKEFTKLFGVLSTPTEESFVSKHKRRILQSAQMIIDTEKLKNIFLEQKPEEVERRVREYPKVYAELKSITGDYVWLKGDYVKSTPLALRDTIASVQEQLSSAVDSKKELLRMDEYARELVTQKKKMVVKVGTDKDLAHAIWVIDKLGPLHDWRKQWFLESQYLFEHILQKVSKASSTPIDVLRFCTPAELSGILQNKKVDTKLIERRKKYSVIISDIEGHHFYYGEEAQHIEEQELSSGENEVINLLKGTAASVGVAVGTAKVAYSAEEAMRKVEKGDILVTSMTRPDFVLVMKRAAGIVTNEGGLTCHAAIVSRELGLPCVVGTKIATRIVQDGDIIEVNGNHGIIYIVKRQSGE